MTFINELTKGDKFLATDGKTVYTVVSVTSQPGATRVVYTAKDMCGDWSFVAPGLTTVTKIGN